MAGLEKCANGYCEIPGGTFQMGLNTDHYLVVDDRRTERMITMTGFQMGQTEVSVSDYEAYCRKRASGFLGTLKSLLSGHGWNGLKKCIPDRPENLKGDSYPVVDLSWEESRAYCKAQGGDLPTAAQHKYASRFDYDEKNINGEVVTWYKFKSAQPVTGGYKNLFGIYNLLGNVSERTSDDYDASFYARMSSHDPYNSVRDPHDRNEVSGGCFKSSACGKELWAERSWIGHRVFLHEGGTVGFRCARPLPQGSKKVK